MIGRSGLVAAYLVGAIAIGSAQQAPPDDRDDVSFRR